MGRVQGAWGRGTSPWQLLWEGPSMNATVRKSWQRQGPDKLPGQAPWKNKWMRNLLSCEWMISACRMARPISACSASRMACNGSIVTVTSQTNQYMYIWDQGGRQSIGTGGAFNWEGFSLGGFSTVLLYVLVPFIMACHGPGRSCGICRQTLGSRLVDGGEAISACGEGGELGQRPAAVCCVPVCPCSVLTVLTASGIRPSKTFGKGSETDGPFRKNLKTTVLFAPFGKNLKTSFVDAPLGKSSKTSVLGAIFAESSKTSALFAPFGSMGQGRGWEQVEPKTADNQCVRERTISACKKGQEGQEWRSNRLCDTELPREL